MDANALVGLAGLDGDLLDGRGGEYGGGEGDEGTDAAGDGSGAGNLEASYGRGGDQARDDYLNERRGMHCESCSWLAGSWLEIKEKTWQRRVTGKDGKTRRNLKPAQMASAVGGRFCPLYMTAVWATSNGLASRDDVGISSNYLARPQDH